MTAGQIPGFVDLQVNGFEGVDFSGGELTEESFTQAALSLLRRGTAAFLTHDHHMPARAASAQHRHNQRGG